MASTRALTLRLSSVLLTVVLGGAEQTLASGMGLALQTQMNVLGPGPLGRNLLALPARNPYQGAGGPERLCQVLGLATGAQVIQFDGLGLIYTHPCGGAPQFELIDHKGVLVLDPGGTRNGLVIGSDVPEKVIPIHDLGRAPVGINLFPVDYHTTFVTPEDLCVGCTLSGTATVTRFDALNGIVMTHQCGTIPLWTLVQGEAVLIYEDQGPRTCTPPHL